MALLSRVPRLRRDQEFSTSVAEPVTLLQTPIPSDPEPQEAQHSRPQLRHLAAPRLPHLRALAGSARPLRSGERRLGSRGRPGAPCSASEPGEETSRDPWPLSGGSPQRGEPENKWQSVNCFESFIIFRYSLFYWNVM